MDVPEVCFRIEEIPEGKRQSGVYRGDSYQIVLHGELGIVPGSQRPKQEQCQTILDQILSCGLCRKYTVERVLHGTNVPEHRGSMYCQSGSIASGGTVSHCTCGHCF